MGSLLTEKMAALYMSILQDGALGMQTQFYHKMEDGTIIPAGKQMQFETPFYILKGIEDKRMEDSLSRHLDSLHNEMSINLIFQLLQEIVFLNPALEEIIKEVMTLNFLDAEERQKAVDEIIFKLISL
jgi:hypothetical protein